MISRHASDTSSIKSKPPINLSPSKIGLLHYFSESCYNIGWVPLAVVVMIQGTECRISHISTSNHPHSRSSTARPPNEGSPRNLIGNINEHGTLNTAEISRGCRPLSTTTTQYSSLVVGLPHNCILRTIDSDSEICRIPSFQGRYY